MAYPAMHSSRSLVPITTYFRISIASMQKIQIYSLMNRDTACNCFMRSNCILQRMLTIKKKKTNRHRNLIFPMTQEHIKKNHKWDLSEKTTELHCRLLKLYQLEQYSERISAIHCGKTPRHMARGCILISTCL